MKYLVATFTIDCSEDMGQVARDLLAEAAGEVGFEAFEETTDGLSGYVQTTLFSRSALDTAIAGLQLPGVKITYDVAEVADQDWNADWEEQGFEPIRVEDKCVIYDAKHTDKQASTEECAQSGCMALFIEARQAFGTGTHQTTRMVLAELLASDLHGAAILDCGCGTGILGIAAAKAGASRIVAYDIDEWSVENAKHNATINEVRDLQVLLGDGRVLDGLQDAYDVVVANINRNILLADLPRFFRRMKKQGRLVLSGFYESDIPMLSAAAEKLGGHEVRRYTDEEWACVVYQQ